MNPTSLQSAAYSESTTAVLCDKLVECPRPDISVSEYIAQYGLICDTAVIRTTPQLEGAKLL